MDIFAKKIIGSIEFGCLIAYAYQIQTQARNLTIARAYTKE